MQGDIIKKRSMPFAFEKIFRISLSFKLVPVLYREHEYRPLYRNYKAVRTGCLPMLSLAKPVNTRQSSIPFWSTQALMFSGTIILYSLPLYNPSQKQLGHLSCISHPPFPVINFGKYRVFSIKKGKNHLIINIESWGRGELTSCPNSFVWDCG